MSKYSSTTPSSLQEQYNSSIQPPVASKKSEKTSNYQYIFKIILIGDSSTGKTSLIHRFVNKTFDDKYLCTIGVDFFMKTVDIDDNVIKLQIWDTAGMEKYKAISSSYYRGSHAAFIIFDLCCRTSFESVTRWLETYYKFCNLEFKKNILLIGNKVDLVDQRVVSREEAENFAESNKMMYWETSAKEGNNVEEVFSYVGKFLFTNFREEMENVGGKKYEKNSNFTNLFEGNENKGGCC